MIKIDELINKLQEIREKYGNLDICRENPYPLNMYDTELYLTDINVFSDTGVFQDFKYVYLEFERDKVNGSWKQDKGNSITFTIEYNHEVNRRNLVLKLRNIIECLNKENL